jgi:hypothetical protein
MEATRHITNNVNQMLSRKCFFKLPRKIRQTIKKLQIPCLFLFLSRGAILFALY